MGQAKNWTPEEIEYLEEKWGSVALKSIAKKLGRSLRAVRLKAHRMGLGDPMLHFDGITVSQLANVLNTSYSVLKNWIKLYDFPAKEKVFVTELKVLVVKYEDFWKWAKKNKQMLDFSRLEPNLLGPEPDWVEEKRKADQLKKLKIKTTPWTTNDDANLKHMLNAFKYTYTDIARHLSRSEAAVKRRILDLGLKQRPVRRNNHIKYKPEEVELLVSMYESGYDLDTIAERLGKSALGVRGKLERMGYKFKNGVPVIS